MHVPKTLAAAVAGLALAGAALVAPASAAEDSTTATITLSEGVLSIDAPATASGTASVAPGSTISFSVGTTTVTDNRGSLLGWTVTGTSQDFVKDADNKIPAARLTWATANLAGGTGSHTGVSAGAGGAMGAPFAIAAALPAGGAGSFTYTGTVTGLVPVNLKTGAYAGNITQSVI